MPTLETIRRLKMEATTSGVAQATTELNKLAAAEEGVAKSADVMAKSTDSASKGATSTEERYRRQTLALDEAARMQDKYAKAAQVADQMLGIGKITAEQHAQRLADLSAKYQQASTASKAFAQATSSVSGQLVAMAAGFGPVSVFLSALGPWGIAAAVGLNLVSGAFDKLRETAAAAGQKARDLVELSEATKLTINELRGLKEAAAASGVEGDQLEGWLTKAAMSMEKAKTGSGELADALRAIDPAFLTALQQATTMAQRLDVLSRAAASAKEQGKDVSLFWRDVFGRGSGRADMVMQATQMAGGIAAVGETMKKYGGTTEAEIRHRAELSEQNTKYAKELEALNATLLKSTKVLELEQAGLRVSIALKKQLIEIEKQLEEAGLSGAQAEAQATRDLASPEIVRRAQDRNRYTGPARAPQQYGPPVPAGGIRDIEAEALALGKLQDAALKAMAAVDTLTAAQQKYNENALKIGALGDAATAAEKASVANDKLKVSLEEGAFGAKDSAEALELYARALAAVDLAKQIQENQELIGVLGSLASVQDLVAQKELQIAKAKQHGIEITEEQKQELLAQVAVQAELAQVAPGTYERQLAELEKLKAAYPGLTAAQAQAARSLDQQLQLAQAVTGVQKMMVQEAIDYQSALDRGLTAEQAATEAATKHAIAVAQVTAAAQAQLLSLRDQYAVASAVTGAEKMRAQATATLNQLLRDGVQYETAMAVAAQEYANAVASANAAVEQTIHGLEQQLEVLKASTQEEKDKVLARQAYDDAIRSGADVETAMRLQAATEAVSSEKRYQAEETARLNALDAQRVARAKELNEEQRKYNQYIEELYAGMHQLLDEMNFNVPHSANRVETGIPWQPGSVSWFGPGPLPQQQMRTPEQDQQEHDARIQKQVNDMEMARVEAQISGNKAAEIAAIQQELAYYRAQPRTLESLNQIKSLQDALTQLTDATKDNTAVTATLSDIYSAGHAGRIGYYAEGETTAVIGQPTINSNPPVWGTPITTAPPAANNNRLPPQVFLAGIPRFAEGGIITRPTLALVGEAGPETITPAGKGGATVVQNFNILMPARSDLGDRSTQRQMFEGIGRRAAVSR